MPLVLDSDYNNLRTRIVDVMGTSTTGYGQTLTATTDVVGDYATNTTSTDKITATQWNNLYIDMIRARVHQNASFTQQSLWTTSDKVETVDLTYLQGLMTTIEQNRYVLDVANQASIGVLKTQTFTNWNGTQTATLTAQFSTVAARNYYFNSGSQIRISISNNYVGTDSKTNEWKTMFSQMGNVVFNYTETYSENSSGTGSLIGNEDLTSTDQTVYFKTASTYTGNEIRIKARNSSTTTIIFTVELSDFDAPPAPGIDENVQGTTTVTYSSVRADGTVLIGATNYDTVVVTAPTSI